MKSTEGNPVGVLKTTKVRLPSTYPLAVFSCSFTLMVFSKDEDCLHCQRYLWCEWNDWTWSYICPCMLECCYSAMAFAFTASQSARSRKKSSLQRPVCDGLFLKPVCLSLWWVAVVARTLQTCLLTYWKIMHRDGDRRGKLGCLGQNQRIFYWWKILHCDGDRRAKGGCL